MRTNLEVYLFWKLYLLAVDYAAIGNVMIQITKLSRQVFYGIYLGFTGFLVLNGDGMIVPFIVGPAAGFLLTNIFRKLWLRPRPFVAFGIRSLIAHEGSGSFPSKHAMSAFAIGVCTLYVSVPLGVIVLVLAGITSLSRVMVGVHYPLDVFVGAMTGAVVVALAFTLFLVL